MSTSRTTVGDTVQTELWPIPTAAVIAALLLGVGLPEVDAAVGGELSPTVSEWLFGVMPALPVPCSPRSPPR